MLLTKPALTPAPHCATAGPTYGRSSSCCFRPISLSGAPPQTGRPQVATTISDWFSYSSIEEVASKARDLNVFMQQRQTAKALRMAVQLVDILIAHGMSTALVVRHAQLLDPLSYSLLREA